MASNVLSQLYDFTLYVNSHPQDFYLPSAGLQERARSALKLTFDYAKRTETREIGPLPELYVEGFDSEQLWEELQLQNQELNQYFDSTFSSLQKEIGKQPLPSAKPESDQYSDDIDSSAALSQTESDSESTSSTDDQNEALARAQRRAEINDISDNSSEQSMQEPAAPVEQHDDVTEEYGSARKTIEDSFFSFDQMERFMAEQDEPAQPDHDDNESESASDGSESGSIDYFAAASDDSEDGHAAQAGFRDFFDDVGLERPVGSDVEESESESEGADSVLSEQEAALDKILDAERAAAGLEDTGSEEDDDGTDEEESAAITSHQRRQQQLQEQINQFEQDLIGDKPWEMTGEVTKRSRPENSLLSSVLEYEYAQKQAPQITVETTEALEDLIRRRILDEAWDDVERKTDPTLAPKPRELVEVSTEKSKEGLGEIYAQEYLRTALGFKGEDEKQKQQDEISELFKTLCHKLDALSNFHYTPKPVVKDLSVKPNAPAIAMEEAIPITMSSASQAAPEEVFSKRTGRQGVLRGQSEMNPEEREAARRAKKAARRKNRRQRTAQQKRLEKSNAGLGNKYSKQAIQEAVSAKNVSSGTKSRDGVNFHKSSQFFAKLQSEARSTINDSLPASKAEPSASSKRSSQLKL